MKKLILFCVFIVNIYTVYGQKDIIRDEHYLSPNGLFETVFDHYGNSYQLSDILISKEVRTDKNNLSRSVNSVSMSCGYYNVFFETGSGMEDSSNPIHMERRDVLCRVLTDLSNFINSPLTTNGLNNKVNIWVRNINNVITLPNTPNGVLGMASSFYTMPHNTTTGFGGIIDNEIWKTIHLGKDSYTNTVSPLLSNGINAGQSGIFYHGMMAFNFNTTDTAIPNTPSILWNTSLSATSFPGKYDLYTVILHEMTHALGFASLLNSNGLSKFNSAYNYFNRYDTRLKNNANTQFLIKKQIRACGSMYDYVFNNLLNTSVLQPNSNTCNDKVRYVGLSNVPVHTPTVFSPPSSLSHFEGVCVSPNPSFVMESATGANIIKRFLKPQERNVLGDLGYSLNNSYGVSTTYQGTTTYTGTITGIDVAGMNDGINTIDNSFAFIGNSGTAIAITGILNNDFTTNNSNLRFECLQDVYDSSATFSSTSGTSATTVTFNSTVTGVHLLRYVPFNNLTQQRGNITYVYVYVMNTNNCAIPTACNLVMNGDFEQFSTLQSQFSPVSLACGWNAANGATPDYFHTDALNINFKVPCNYFGYQSDKIQGNNAYAGFVANNVSTNQENIVTTLSSPLLPNSIYQLSFDVSLGEGVSYFLMKPQAYLSTSYNITASNGYITISNPNMLYNSPNFPSVSNSWERVTIIIETGPVAGERFLYLGTLNNHVPSGQVIPGTAPGCNYANYGGAVVNATYYYIDNVELVPLEGASLNIPDEHCQNIVLSDLSSYIMSAPPNGVFSGSGVTVSGGNYSFNASVAGLGTHTITYSYINSAGCPITISSDVSVLDCYEPEDCPANLTFTTTEIGNADYQASSDIVVSTNYLVNSGLVIEMTAGNSITFDPNSEMKFGSDFHAYIENCSFSERITNSVEDAELEKLTKVFVYPNPTKGLTTIVADGININAVTVTSIEGKIMYTSKNNYESNYYDLDLVNFETGVYIVNIEMVNGQILSRKIIKN
ncbi:hypothetical protein J2X31_003669 [Flavobacterium arsenatis]|uniref:Secretion system C-terminal sorting domain-containing protein n=1 Tax=Flavobacterium arsenatis TaxID=1484332 RepID=A0ABU1TUW9_9FLAO|nr:T9SS type A sorting domain-containing protein [Flavobacterium arsenatis]MDR6969636.1 hypothetical protein [Flavobacterium arsenatis]